MSYGSINVPGKLTPADIGAATSAEVKSAYDLAKSKKKTARFVVGTSTAGWTANDVDYLCDGTADDVEINAAIQALPATGGEVVILDGTYSITAPIAIDKNCVTLTGSGASTVLKWTASAQNGVNGSARIIFVTSNHNVIREIHTDGSFPDYCSGIYVTGSNNLIIGNLCEYKDGISVTNGNIVANNVCDAKDNTSTKGYVGINAGDYSVIEGNICINANVGIGVSEGFAIGNTCRNNVTGIYLGSNRGGAIGNFCSQNTDGIWVKSAQCLIKGNFCVDNTNAGIKATNGGGNNLICGNTLSNNYCYGIYLSATKRSVISSNIIDVEKHDKAPNPHEIYMSSCSGVNIVGNVIGIRPSSNTISKAIWLSSTYNSDNVITDNIIGIDYISEGGTNNVFTNNKVYN